MLETVIDFLCGIAGMLPFECMKLRFMQEAFLGVLLTAPLAAAAGIQVVNFRMSFFSDAIGHSAFAGVALGLIFGLSPDLTMPLLALVIGIGIMAMKQRSALSSDTVIGVFFSAVVAFGLALVSRNPNVARDMQVFLYGDILTVTHNDLLYLFLLFCVFFMFQVFAYNRLNAIGIHEQLARTHRIHTDFFSKIRRCASRDRAFDRSGCRGAQFIEKFRHDVLDFHHNWCMFRYIRSSDFRPAVGGNGVRCDHCAVCMRHFLHQSAVRSLET